MRDIVDQLVADTCDSGDGFDDWPEEITSNDIRDAILKMFTDAGRADYASGALFEPVARSLSLLVIWRIIGSVTTGTPLSVRSTGPVVRVAWIVMATICRLSVLTIVSNRRLQWSCWNMTIARIRPILAVVQNVQRDFKDLESRFGYAGCPDMLDDRLCRW